MAELSADARIRDLERRLDMDPGSRLFVSLAEEYRKLGRFKQALSALQKGLLAHPGYIAAQVALGRVYLEVGQSTDSIATFTKVLVSDPGNLVAAKSLADIYLGRGDKLEAVKKYKLYRALSGDRKVDEQILALEAQVTPRPATPTRQVQKPAEPPPAPKFHETDKSRRRPSVRTAQAAAPLVDAFEITSLEFQPGEDSGGVRSEDPFPFVPTRDTAISSPAGPPAPTAPPPASTGAAAAATTFAAPEAPAAPAAPAPPEPLAAAGPTTVLPLAPPAQSAFLDSPTAPMILPKPAPPLEREPAPEPAPAPEAAPSFSASSASGNGEGAPLFQAALDAVFGEAPALFQPAEIGAEANAAVGSDDGSGNGNGNGNAEPSAAPSIPGAPQSPTGRALADLYYSQGHYAEALQIYDDLVTRHPFDEELMRMRRDAEARLLPAALASSAAGADPGVERRRARIRVLERWLSRVQAR